MAFKKPKVHYNWEASLVDAALISCAAPKISPSRGPPLSSCRPRATPPLLQAAGLLCAPFPSPATCTQVHPVPWVTEAVHRALTFPASLRAPGDRPWLAVFSVPPRVLSTWEGPH